MKPIEYVFTIGVVALFVLFVIFQPKEFSEFDWMTRCNQECKYTLGQRRLVFIDKQDCETLPEMYKMDHNKNDQYWKAVVDDKATSLGCEGFPKK